MLETMTESLQIRQVLLGKGYPKICVPLLETEREALKKAAEEAVKEQSDLIEWRADFYERIDEPESVKETLDMLRAVLGDIPLIFTVRTKNEGGNQEFSLERYGNILEQVSRYGEADLIDVEYFQNPNEMRKLIDVLHKNNSKVIGSHHNFSLTYPKRELIQRMREMDQAGADILKMAMMPENFDQVCDLLKATREMVQEYTKHPVVTMSMSEMGRVSRYAGEVFGSCMTFAAVGKISAPGQEDIGSMRKALQFYHENFV